MFFVEVVLEKFGIIFFDYFISDRLCQIILLTVNLSNKSTGGTDYEESHKRIRNLHSDQEQAN